jgi:hypothetical protein
MIKSIVSQSPWLTVNTYNNTPYMPGPSQSAGMVRYNTNMQRLEVYDGNIWLELGGGSSVELSSNANEIMRWAENKMKEENELEQLAKTHPTVQDSLNKLKEAEAQLRVVAALCKEDNVAG